MAKFGKDVVARWREEAAAYLSHMCLSLEAVRTPGDAWTVAHRAGITQEAYQDRTVTDTHIETALRAIFPNAGFRRHA